MIAFFQLKIFGLSVSRENEQGEQGQNWPTLQSRHEEHTPGNLIFRSVCWASNLEKRSFPVFAAWL
jgi:hypothetical protein